MNWNQSLPLPALRRLIGQVFGYPHSCTEENINGLSCTGNKHLDFLIEFGEQKQGQRQLLAAGSCRIKIQRRAQIRWCLLLLFLLTQHIALQPVESGTRATRIWNPISFCLSETVWKHFHEREMVGLIRAYHLLENQPVQRPANIPGKPLVADGDLPYTCSTSSSCAESRKTWIDPFSL